MAVRKIIYNSDEYYFITDSQITDTLGKYIGYSEKVLREEARKKLTYDYLISQFEILYKDIVGVLNSNFKMNRKISEYDDYNLVNEIMNYNIKNESQWEKSALIAIIKVLDRVRSEIREYSKFDISDYSIFGGEASFLHMLFLHIEEFAGLIATKREKKNYNHCYSRKRMNSMEVFDLASSVSRGMVPLNEMSHIHEMVFFIRQAIELKVLEVLYIKMVYNKKTCKPVKITPDRFLNLLDSDEVKMYDINGNQKNINVSLIQKIHLWTNSFIHSGRGYWAWEAEYIRLMVVDFICGQVRIEKEYLQKIPDLILGEVKEDERKDIEVVMTKQYYNLLGVSEK